MAAVPTVETRLWERGARANAVNYAAMFLGEPSTEIMFPDNLVPAQCEELADAENLADAEATDDAWKAQVKFK